MKIVIPTQRFKSITLLLIYYLTGCLLSFSQDYVFDTEIINVKEGLPHRMVYNTVQDQERFIWMSTQGAISRYDGYNFKTYNASFLHIKETSATRLAVDANKRLWYCETNSIVPGNGVIDTAKDSLYSIETISKGLITSEDIMYLGNSKMAKTTVFLATRSGSVYKYDSDFQEIYRFPGPVSGPVICEAAPDGSYWITCNKDIIRVKKGKLLRKIHAGAMITNIISIYPEVILEMGYQTPRYWKLDNYSLKPFSIAPHAPKEIKNLYQFHKDYVCYTTKDDLFIRDVHGKLIYSFDKVAPSDYRLSLPNRSIAMLDQQDILWISTENGLIKLNVKKNPFEILQAGISIRGILKKDNKLWVGGGSYRYSSSDSIVLEQQYLADANSKDVMTFYEDLQGHLWIGTSVSELVKYIPERDEYIHYNFDMLQQRLNLPFQNSVTKNYWVGHQLWIIPP